MTLWLVYGHLKRFRSSILIFRQLRKFIFNISFFLFLWIALLTVLMAASHLLGQKISLPMPIRKAICWSCPMVSWLRLHLVGISHGRNFHVAPCFIWIVWDGSMINLSQGEFWEAWKPIIVSKVFLSGKQ